MKTINVGEDFHKYPGGRYLKDGEGNATAFREQFLLPILKNNEKAVIVLDSTVGYPACFLEEAFGGLVSIHGYDSKEVLDAFKFQSGDQGFEFFEYAIVRILNSVKTDIKIAAAG